MQSARKEYDVVVVGAGPNGLAAAITVAETGRSVVVLEAQATIGGGTRTAELTLPGFLHDVCSSVHPMAVWSPFFRNLPLDDHGLEWVHPTVPLAHPLDDGSAVCLERSVEATASNLGLDVKNYLELFGPLVLHWPKMESVIATPLRWPEHPVATARFGVRALRSASGLALAKFADVRARALFAGLAAHSVLPLESTASSAAGLVLGIMAHRGGWPFARGGSGNIAGALASYLRSLGGEIVTSSPVISLEDAPRSRAVLLDVTPRQLARLAGPQLGGEFRRKLEAYPYRPGVCKVDWALDARIPWTAHECAGAGTVHLGGTLEEIASAERGPWEGVNAEKPFVLLAQPTLFDPTRAPAGKHIAWAYCHVPNGSPADMSERIEAQVERFAPGFRQRILARSVRVAARMESYNSNLIGGDISGGGAEGIAAVFFRPTWRRYRTPAKGIYLCSSSTPPGGGVHGLCGQQAARAALHDLF